jgi:hypothetical protein
MINSLLTSCPNIFLNPTSVKGLMNRDIHFILIVIAKVENNYE